ncbi:hypothetical protein [Nocardia salmonicida]|nr:hypothetical protein [Nocardia salmonicida]
MPGRAVYGQAGEQDQRLLGIGARLGVLDDERLPRRPGAPLTVNVS